MRPPRWGEKNNPSAARRHALSARDHLRIEVLRTRKRLSARCVEELIAEPAKRQAAAANVGERVP